MTHSTSIQTYWQHFCEKSGTDPQTPYGAFAFGDTEAMADELVQLVLEGKKTGTSSAYELYFLPGETEALPKTGQIDIILDGREQPVGIIQNKRVDVLPFKDINADQARKEGEGDLSLDYWRRVHINFWAPYFQENNLNFTDDTAIVYEEFTLIDKRSADLSEPM